MTSPVDVAWVDVLPSMKNFLPDLRSTMRAALPKAGAEAGDVYGRSFAQSATANVEKASAAIAAARRKEEDAAGRVRVAEAKLQDLRGSSRATASQLVAAEENLAKAERNLTSQSEAVQRSSRNLTDAQRQQARATDEASTGMANAHRGSGILTGGLSRLQGGIVLASGALLAGSGLVAGLTSLYTQAAESARIGRITAQVIKSTGGAAQITAGQVSSLATAVSDKTGMDDEAVQSGENLLLTFTRIRNEAGAGNDIFNQATQIITDMSAALGQDLSSSAIQVGKALNDPIKGVTALQRVGVSFTASQKEQIQALVETGDVLGAQKIILHELGTEFGGAAAAAATPLDRLKVNVGNVAEQIGGYLIPAVDKASTWLSGTLIPAVQSTVTWTGDHLGGALHLVWVAISDVVQIGAGIVHFFGELPTPIMAGVTALGLFLLLRAPLDAFFTGIAVKITGLVTGAGMAVTSMAGLKAAGAGLLSTFGGPWGIAITGVTVGLGFLVSWLSKDDAATRRVADATKSYADALRQANGVIDENARKAAAKAAQDSGLLTFARKIEVSLPAMTDAITRQGDAYGTVRARITDYIAGLQQQIQAAGSAMPANTQLSLQLQGQETAAKASLAAFDKLAGTTSTETARAQELATAAGTTGTAMGSAAADAKAWQTGLEDSAQAASDAKQQTNLLKLALDDLTGKTVDITAVESAFYASVNSAKTALEGATGRVLDNTGALDLHTEAGQKTRDTLVGLASDANSWISTMEQQGETDGVVQAKDAELRAAFYATALQMTGNKKAAEDLTNQYYGIPEKRRTEIEADTSQATQAARDIQAQIDALHGRTVTVQAILDSGHFGGASNWIATPRATGGPIPGHSPNDRADNVLIAATAGEFMQPVPAVRRYGMGFMDAVRTGRFPTGLARAYADGGPVAPVSIKTEMDASVERSQFASYAASVAKGMAESVGPYVAALQFANAQVGKPYIWGAAGPSGYDCSGFMSALTNVIRGRYPYSRVGSTGTFPWSGFAPGYGVFSIGSTPDAGGGIGHMAGTLLGVNVESTGGHVRTGAAARGANSGLFSERDHLVADTGGLAPHGSLVANLSGGIERWLSPEQDDYFRRFVSAAEDRAQAAPVASSVSGLVNNGTILTTDLGELARTQKRATQRALATSGVRVGGRR